MVTTKLEHSFETYAKELIRKAGYRVDEFVAYFPPIESGHCGELWLMGHSLKRGTPVKLTAWLPCEKEARVLITHGW